MSSDILVSVICNAYNHEMYIRDSIEGFIMQKTNFRFEVLIHDDASTDQTSSIIKEYEKKYPKIIKPIYQSVNQYSKGNGIVSKIQYARAKGKYIALCEGDDYWTDPYKLQKQFDLLEKYKEIDMCAHAAWGVEAETKSCKFKIAPAKNQCVLSAEQVILGGGGFLATNSLFFRSSLNDIIPDFRKKFMLDYTLQIQGSLRGGIIYIPETMSAYRLASKGSWSVKQRNNIDLQVEHEIKLCRMFEQLNVDTQFKYYKAVAECIMKRKFVLLLIKREYEKILREKEYKKLYRNLPFKSKMKIRIMILWRYIKRGCISVWII